MKRIAALLILLPLLLGTRCTRSPVTPVPALDAGPEPATAETLFEAPAPKDDCERACDHRAALGCEDGKPTPAGGTCAEVCHNAAHTGYLAVDTACLESSKSCAECIGGEP